MAGIKFPPDQLWWRGGVGLPGFSSAPAAPFTPADLSPALWIDPSDASTVTISGSSGAYIGPNGLVLSGSNSNGAETPYSAALGITGDIDLRAKATATDWTPAAGNSYVFSRYGSTSGYGLGINSSGFIILFYSSGGVERTALSTSATGFTDGTSGWIRATFATGSGDIVFYTSTDGSSWTQLGTTVAGTAGALVAGTTALRHGTLAYTGGNWNGTVHRVQVYNGIAGTKVYDADFENATPYVSAFTESALGTPVYVVSSTATSSTASYSYIGPEGLVCSGSGANYASTPDSAALDITGDIDIIVKATAPSWSSGVAMYLLSKSATTNGYGLVVRASGLLGLYIGSGVVESTTVTGLAAGSTSFIRATRIASSGDVEFFTSADGASWTKLGSTVTGASGALIANATQLSVGVYNTSTSPFLGTIHRAIVKNGIDGTTVFDADFVSAADYATSFTESSSNAATVTITATNTPANAAGALVSQIDDKSGNARHLTEGTAANMPKYWNGINGNNVLVFDGVNDRLTGGDILDLGTKSLTHYAIARPNSTADMTLFGKYKVTPQSGMWLSIIESSGFQGVYVPAATTARTALSGTVVANAPGVHGSITDRVAGTLVERRNGVEGPITASFTPDNATNHDVATHFWVGTLRNSTDTGFQSGYWWAGSMGDIIVCLEALGATDRDNLEDYLMTKAGVS